MLACGVQRFIHLHEFEWEYIHSKLKASHTCLTTNISLRSSLQKISSNRISIGRRCMLNRFVLPGKNVLNGISRSHRYSGAATRVIVVASDMLTKTAIVCWSGEEGWGRRTISLGHVAVPYNPCSTSQEKYTPCTSKCHMRRSKARLPPGWYSRA